MNDATKTELLKYVFGAGGFLVVFITLITKIIEVLPSRVTAKAAADKVANERQAAIDKSFQEEADRREKREANALIEVEKQRDYWRNETKEKDVACREKDGLYRDERTARMKLEDDILGLRCRMMKYEVDTPKETKE